ncbi:AhpA/YtjB family protein [Shewanella gaetbuli]
MIFVKGLKKRQKFSRIVQVLIAIGLVTGLVHLWQTNLKNGQKLLSSQTQLMARTLAQQAANGAAPAMFLQNDEQLQWLTSTLVTDPKVISVNIYNSQGVRLAFDQSVTEKSMAPDSEEMRQLLAQYPPLIENVMQDENNLGYVEVRLNLSEFFNEITYLHQQNMELLKWMLMVAALIGFLLSRSLSFKRADFDRRKTRTKRLKKRLASKPTQSAEDEQ